MENTFYNTQYGFCHPVVPVAVINPSSGSSPQPEPAPPVVAPQVSLSVTPTYIEINKTTTVTAKATVTKGSGTITSTTINGVEGVEKTYSLSPTSEQSYTYKVEVKDSNSKTASASKTVYAVHPVYIGSTIVDQDEEGEPIKVDWNTEKGKAIILNNKIGLTAYSSVSKTISVSAPDTDHYYTEFIAYPVSANKNAKLWDNGNNSQL